MVVHGLWYRDMRREWESEGVRGGERETVSERGSQDYVIIEREREKYSSYFMTDSQWDVY